MKNLIFTISTLLLINLSLQVRAQKPGQQLYMDVHVLEPGKVKFEDVAAAHKKDLATQDKYGVSFMKYWVDEEAGLVYCLSSASDSNSVIKTHAEAHGLIPKYIYPVSDGDAAKMKGNKNLYLDIHYLGAGNVTAKDVSEAHDKDLAIQDKYGVNFINYWVNEEDGVVMCLSQAGDSTAVINTHKQAHGLVPATVLKVQEGE